MNDCQLRKNAECLTKINWFVWSRIVPATLPDFKLCPISVSRQNDINIISMKNLSERKPVQHNRIIPHTCCSRAVSPVFALLFPWLFSTYGFNISRDLHEMIQGRMCHVINGNDRDGSTFTFNPSSVKDYVSGAQRNTLCSIVVCLMFNGY
jgi:hypothetical protein